MLSDTPIPTYPYNTAHTYIDAHNRNIIQNPQTHCQHTFLITYSWYSISYTRQVDHSGVKKKCFLEERKGATQKRGMRLVRCMCLVAVQGEKQQRRGSQRGNDCDQCCQVWDAEMTDISRICSQWCRQIPTHASHHPPSPRPPAWTLPPQEEVMSQQILNVVS